MTLVTAQTLVRAGLFASVLVPAAVTIPAGDATAADFYAGKQLRLIVGSNAGGGYDTYTRLLGRHITGHVPGNPSIVVLNMPGGGGLKRSEEHTSELQSLMRISY